MTVTQIVLRSYSLSGHRDSYIKLIQAMLSSHGCATPLNSSATASPQFFLMIEESHARFALGAVRALFDRHRHIGLFFRPGECFKGNHIKYRMKYALFRVLSRLPHTEILTILPFSVEPRFHKVATGWIYDPQLWDLSFFPMPPEDAYPALDQEICSRAQDRKVLVALGAQNRIKGFDELSEIWCASEELRASHLFVAAGKVTSASRDHAVRFMEKGGLLIDRQLDNHEMLHLYRRADAIWSCYAEDYNQASGIFGRAVQLGVPAIVRKGSYLEPLANELDHPILPLKGATSQERARRMLAWSIPARTQTILRRELVERMRQESLARLFKALGLDETADANAR